MGSVVQGFKGSEGARERKSLEDNAVMAKKHRSPSVPKVVCGECGGELKKNLHHCPHCNAPVAWGVDKGIEVQKEVNGVCIVCGHHNVNPGKFCEACGAAIPGLTKIAEAEKPAKKRSAKRQLEPWHYFAGVVIVGVLGYFVISEFDRESSPLQQNGEKAGDDHTHDDPHGESAAAIRELETLQKKVANSPDDAPSLLRMANILHDLSLKDPRLLVRAVAAYQQFLTLKPDDPNARVDLGIVYFELAKVDTLATGENIALAVKEMETVAKAHPDHQPALFNLGIVNLNAGNTKESTAWFKKAIEVNPNSELGKRASQLLEQHVF